MRRRLDGPDCEGSELLDRNELSRQVSRSAEIVT